MEVKEAMYGYGKHLGLAFQVSGVLAVALKASMCLSLQLLFMHDSCTKSSRTFFQGRKMLL